MESIEAFICCGRAKSESLHVLSSLFPSACHHFPAVLFQWNLLSFTLTNDFINSPARFP
jgi:hypothetical protein